jgi:AcrR family transcriptional regulator
LQILKDEVKNKIIEAAVEEFLVNGYANSSLRTIAAQAGITIGNIYSYFSSKDDLFETVVAPAWDALERLMALEFPGNGNAKTDANIFMEISNKICEAFIANKQRFFILMNGSAGSRFENTVERITEFISNRIKKEFNSTFDEGRIDPLYAKALAASLLAGFFTVFNQYGGDEERLFSLVHELLYTLMGNIQERL